MPEELLQVVLDYDRLIEFDLCSFVVGVLRLAARKVRQVLAFMPRKIVIPGCLIVPQVTTLLTRLPPSETKEFSTFVLIMLPCLYAQIMFLDVKEHGLEALDSLLGPRMNEYSHSLLKSLIAKHLPCPTICPETVQVLCLLKFLWYNGCWFDPVPCLMWTFDNGGVYMTDMFI